MSDLEKLRELRDESFYLYNSFIGTAPSKSWSILKRLCEINTQAHELELKLREAKKEIALC